jgi:hypothetical protein
MVAAVLSVAALRRELSGGEGNAAEHLTGIFSTAGIVAAFLGRQRVVQNRYHQLSVPFQTDDRELPKGHKKTAALSGEYQLLIKQGSDRPGNLYGVLTGAVADLLNL